MTVLKLRTVQETGGHVRVAVFVGPDVDHLALSGHLTFRHEEWPGVRELIGRGSGWRGSPSLVLFEIPAAQAIADELDAAASDHALLHPDPVPGCAMCGVSEGDMR